MLTRLMTTAVLVLLGALGAGAQGPRIAMASDAWDFGAVEQGKRPRHSVRIDNTGKTTLTLERVRTDCGCLHTALTATSIEPGKSAELKLELVTDRQFGPLRYTVFVDSDDPERPRVVFTAEGEVVAPWWLSTRNLQFGSVEAGAGAESRFRILVRANVKTELKRVMTSAPWIELIESAFGEPDREHGWDVVVRVKPEAPVGPLEVAILVETDDPRTNQYEVGISGWVVGPLTIAPQHLQFGRIAGGETAVLGFAVTSSKGPFEILSASCSDDRVTVTVTQKPGSHEAVVTVGIEARGNPGRLLAMVEVVTDVKVQERLNVRCVAMLGK